MNAGERAILEAYVQAARSRRSALWVFPQGASFAAVLFLCGWGAGLEPLWAMRTAVGAAASLTFPLYVAGVVMASIQASAAERVAERLRQDGPT